MNEFWQIKEKLKGKGTGLLLLLTLAWPVSAHRLGGGSDKLWRCKWSWCEPCIYRGNTQLQVMQTQTVVKWMSFQTPWYTAACIMYSIMSSPRTSVLLRCGDGDGEGGEGRRRLGRGCMRLMSPVLEVEGTAGEAAAVAEEEEVGRFWKYCSPGSSSSKPPHGYTCRQQRSTEREIIIDACWVLLLVVILTGSRSRVKGTLQVISQFLPYKNTQGFFIYHFPLKLQLSWIVLVKMYSPFSSVTELIKKKNIRKVKWRWPAHRFPLQ